MKTEEEKQRGENDLKKKKFVKTGRRKRKTEYRNRDMREEKK